MANTHDVHIRGEIPFNVYEDEKATRWLGIMNSPSYGLRISYGGSRFVPNEYGGRTSTYEFTISGREAIWTSGLIELITALEGAGAVISEARAQDLDDPSPWYEIREA